MDTPSPSPTRTTGKSRRKLYWLTALSLLVVVAAALLLWHGRKKPVLITTEKAVIKTITQLVSATGRIQPVNEVKISAEVAGEIIELPVLEGQDVKQGELLTRIKPDNYKAQVEQQLNQIVEAEKAPKQATAAE